MSPPSGRRPYGVKPRLYPDWTFPEIVDIELGGSLVSRTQFPRFLRTTHKTSAINAIKATTPRRIAILCIVFLLIHLSKRLFHALSFLLSGARYCLHSLGNGPCALLQFPNHPLAALVRDTEVTEGDFFFLIGRPARLACARAMAGRRRSGKKSSALRANPVPLTAGLMIFICRHRPDTPEWLAMAGRNSSK